MNAIVVFMCLLNVCLCQSSHISTSGLNRSLGEVDPCPPWQVKDDTTGRCMCYPEHVHYILQCFDNPYNLLLHECYCMTFNKQLLVAPCQYTCRRQPGGYFFEITANSSTFLNEDMCGSCSRQDQLCGRCIPGFAPPVYSYSLSCVNCTTSNWAKYTAVSLLPVTAFFVFVITFRVSATSPKLHGLILFSQIATCPSKMRFLETLIPTNKFTYTQRYLVQVFVSVYSVWNLDFFRLVYPPFCLQPHTDTLQVMALDYVIAVYPLLLIVLTYLLVLLYDRNVCLIVCLWKPFVPLLIRFRRQWNIKSSLIDAFATFLLLSYVKVLSVSVDLLLPVVLYDHHGHTLPQLYLFNQGNVPFLGTQHLPYACLALFFLLVFTLLPMLLLFLYPCSCFQVCLNRTGCSCQPLHTFMDIFQGHYKDGTNGTHDLRFFSGLYLLLRGIVYASTVLAYQVSSYAYTTVFLTLFTIIVTLVQPYKKYVHNGIEVFFLAITTIIYVTLMPLTFYHSHVTEDGLRPIIMVMFVLVLAYTILLFLYTIKSSVIVSRIWYKLCLKVKTMKQQLIFVGRGHEYERL